MLRTDVHQHLWPESLIGELARRERPPYVRRAGTRWRLVLEGEPDHLFEVAQHDPDVRRSELAAAGIERAVIALSAPLGIEGLPADEAGGLLESYHSGILELGEPFGAWGSVPLRSPDPNRVDELLDRGFVGIAVPAGALSHRRGLARCRGLLSRLERRGAPLFIHPGPDPLAGGVADDGDPAWWPAMTGYVGGMNSAWHAYAAWGRLSHPGLRVVFAMLAGGAPLHYERSATRGGPADAISDDRFFYDSSSYGARTVDAVVRTVGVDQIVYGSDRPVVRPAAPDLLGPAAGEAMLRANPARLLAAPVAAHEQAVAA